MIDKPILDQIEEAVQQALSVRTNHIIKGNLQEALSAIAEIRTGVPHKLKKDIEVMSRPMAINSVECNTLYKAARHLLHIVGEAND